MPQFGRPSADTSIGNWQDDGGGTTNIFQSIDEVVSSDTDFIRSELAPSNDPYVTKLSTLEDPLVNTNHTIRYRYEKDAPTGSQIDLVAQLRRGYVNEGSPGTLIHQATHVNIPNGWTAGGFTLSGAEADNILDYDDLFMRFTANQV